MCAAIAMNDPCKYIDRTQIGEAVQLMLAADSIGLFAQFCWTPEQADQEMVRAWVDHLQKEDRPATTAAALRRAEVPLRQDAGSSRGGGLLCPFGSGA